MKVLFAVNNEKVSESIIKKYQSMYKEIISSKNVYFFNNIINELQKDKSYDRVVIGEDVELFSNKNYDVIDNFIFDKLDAISDEASNSVEGDIPIIFIASERREKGDPILVKLFGIGIYNVLLGNDRSTENVCRLINQPRTKKEAKIYYKIESDDIEYKPVNPDIVPEDEMNNIIRHYKKIDGNEDAYVSSFDDIAGQYTQTQLKIIAAKLPLKVRAVLEARSPKYQEVMIGSVKGQVKNPPAKQGEKITTRDINNVSNDPKKISLINQQLRGNRLTKPVVIPSPVKFQNVEKVYKNNPQTQTNILQTQQNIPTYKEENNNLAQTTATQYQPISQVQKPMNINETDELPISQNIDESENTAIVEQKRKRGRPKKEKTPEELMQENKPKGKRGRPKKNPQPEEDGMETTENEKETTTLQPIDEEPIDLFTLGDDEDNVTTEPKKDVEEGTILPGLDITDDDDLDNGLSNNIGNDGYKNLNPTTVNPTTVNPTIVSPAYNNTGTTINTPNKAQYINNGTQSFNQPNNNLYGTNTYEAPTDLQEVNINNNVDLSSLLVGDKKIVAFVGTTKNGTSFLINNLACLLSEKGIKTAILDLTENQNAYYIYNLNDDDLRNKANNCIEGLRAGRADGIPVNKNLTVYTTIPGKEENYQDYGNILETLVRNYSLVLLDCDFKTYTQYFVNVQEIYLVQSYDILTIQPLTAFLNELKHKNALDESKLRIVINKALNVRMLTDKMIVDGLSCYNDSAATFQRPLFDSKTIKYTKIPFEEQTYARYLERLVDCKINLNGYSNTFMEALNRLGTMVYPLIANNIKYGPNKNYNDYNKFGKKRPTQFNSSMDETLNKMRKNI